MYLQNFHDMTQNPKPDIRVEKFLEEARGRIASSIRYKWEGGFEGKFFEAWLATELEKLITEVRETTLLEVEQKIMSLPDEKKKGIYRLVNAHTLVCWIQEKLKS